MGKRTEGYRLEIYFSDGSVEQVDEWFSTEEEAEEEYQSWLENYPEGQEVLYLAGDEDYNPATIEGHHIYEDWDEIID